MQGRSSDFDTAIVQTHIAVAQVEIIQDSKVVLRPSANAGSAKADRMVDTMREMTVSLSGQDLVPVDMNSLLAPYGTRMRMRKGVRIDTTDTRSVTYGQLRSWIPSGTSTGLLNGVTVDVDGALTLGP